MLFLFFSLPLYWYSPRPKFYRKLLVKNFAQSHMCIAKRVPVYAFKWTPAAAATEIGLFSTGWVSSLIFLFLRGRGRADSLDERVSWIFFESLEKGEVSVDYTGVCFIESFYDSRTRSVYMEFEGCVAVFWSCARMAKCLCREVKGWYWVSNYLTFFIFFSFRES